MESSDRPFALIYSGIDEQDEPLVKTAIQWCIEKNVIVTLAMVRDRVERQKRIDALKDMDPDVLRLLEYDARRCPHCDRQYTRWVPLWQCLQFQRDERACADQIIADILETDQRIIDGLLDYIASIPIGHRARTGGRE